MCGHGRRRQHVTCATDVEEGQRARFSKTKECHRHHHHQSVQQQDEDDSCMNVCELCYSQY